MEHGFVEEQGLVGEVSPFVFPQPPVPSPAPVVGWLDELFELGGPMRERIRKHLSTVVVAIVAAAVTASAPAIAHGVKHALFAHKAGKVDGKDAVGANTSVNKRKGKLVATDPSTGFLPSNIIAKATDADKLDGISSEGFVRGNGRVEGTVRAASPGGTTQLVLGSSPEFDVYYACPPSPISNVGKIVVVNSGSETINLFVDNGSTAPEYRQLTPDTEFERDTVAEGDHITIQVQEGTGMATIDVFSVHRTSDNTCHVQAQTVFTF